MKIYFTNMGWKKHAIKHLLEGALRCLGQPSSQLEMSLSVVSPSEIRELNKTFRNVDAVTDVLSFPTIDNPERKVIDVSKFSSDVINADTHKLNLGDVIICRERAVEQAQEFGHSLNREMSFLALHGLLHLLGYDHVEPTDEEEMTRLQREILAKHHIDR